MAVLPDSYVAGCLDGCPTMGQNDTCAALPRDHMTRCVVDPTKDQPPPETPAPDAITEATVSGRPTSELRALRGAFKRAMTREPPPAPFAGKRLGRAEVERILAVVH